MIELEKLPTPFPSVVLLSAIVGLGEVLQHTPRAVTLAPPSEMILPPELADVSVIFEIDVVVISGKVATGVVNDLVLPY